MSHEHSEAILQRSGLQERLDDDTAKNLQAEIERFLETQASQLQETIDAGTGNLSAPLRAYTRRLLR